MTQQKSLIDKLRVKPNSKVTVLEVKDEDLWRQPTKQAAKISNRPEKTQDLIFFSAENKEHPKKVKPLQNYTKEMGGNLGDHSNEEAAYKRRQQYLSWNKGRCGRPENGVCLRKYMQPLSWLFQLRPGESLDVKN
jgi:hypothetical protein